MNVIVNIKSLTPPVTGIGRYTAEILKYLSLWNDVEAFDLLKTYSHQELQEKIKHLDDVIKKKTSVSIHTDIKQYIKKIPYSYALRQKIQQQLTRKLFKADSNSIYWEPNFILQPFDGASIASIHDLSHIKHPNYHTQASRQWLDDNLENTIKRADAIVTLSEFSKQEILNYFSVPAEKVKIVSPAVSEAFKVSIEPEEIQKIKKKYHLPENYVLSVGTMEPRKNLKKLLHAYNQLPKQLKLAYPLVLVGAKGWDNLSDIIQPMVDKKELILLGYIAQQDIPSIYKSASLFIYISLYEGYGMPVSEAMASGVAVITSENSAMSEVAGNAAELVNPENEQAITSSIQYYLENETARQELADKGKKQIQNSSWQYSANQLQNILTTVAENQG